MTTDSLPTKNCPNVFDAGLPTLNYTNTDDPEEGHRRIAEAREQAPIAIGWQGPEILTYELVRKVLRDDRFIAHKGLGLAEQGITSGPLWDMATAMVLDIDGEDHTRLRQLVAKSFTPRAVAGLESFIVDLINELVDPHTAKGHCDVVADIGKMYPTPVICELIGAPREDWLLFSDWTDGVVKLFEWNIANDGPIVLAAWKEMREYLDDMLAKRRLALSDELVSDLIVAEDQGRMSHFELLVMLMMLLGAGTDTTRNQLAAATGVLCDYPDQWALLAASPELAPRAVEELIRHSPVFFAAPRVAAQDVELSGVTIPEGTIVMLNLASANRDPAVFENPDRLDITRDSAPPMMSFGGGTHTCVGAHLARLELVAALRVMPRRMPNLRSDGPAPWRNKLAGITGPLTMPITFDPGH